MVMEDWQEANLDLTAEVDTEVCRMGDVAGALHQRFFLTAMFKAKNKAIKGKAEGGGGAKKQWCNFCKEIRAHTTAQCEKKKKAEAKTGKC